MRKNRVFIILMLLLITLSLVSCKEKEELYNIDENYTEITSLILMSQKDEIRVFSYNFELISKENLNEEDYKVFCEIYGRGFVRLIRAEFNSTKPFWCLLEYETTEDAENAYNKLGDFNFYLYKNILISTFQRRLELIYDPIVIDGIKYVNEGKIIIDSDDSKSKLEMNDKVEMVDCLSFRYDSLLEEVICNENLSQIGYGAFVYTYNLKNITLSKNLKKIGAYAFYDSGLEYIVIPESVTHISSDAFNQCNIFCEVESKPSGWAEDFFVEDAKVYYKGQWKYNEEGVPVPLIHDEKDEI